MRKPISTQAHGVIDYLTIATFATLPKILGFSPRLTAGMQAIAATKLCYTLMTNHELGVARVLPMKAHLAMDCVGGATLAALPFLLDEEDDDEVATATCVALGLFDVAAAPMTETTPTTRSLPRTAARGAARMTRGAVSRARSSVGA